MRVAALVQRYEIIKPVDTKHSARGKLIGMTEKQPKQLIVDIGKYRCVLLTQRSKISSSPQRIEHINAISEYKALLRCVYPYVTSDDFHRTLFVLLHRLAITRNNQFYLIWANVMWPFSKKKNYGFKPIFRNY